LVPAVLIAVGYAKDGFARLIVTPLLKRRHPAGAPGAVRTRQEADVPSVANALVETLVQQKA